MDRRLSRSKREEGVGCRVGQGNTALSAGMGPGGGGAASLISTREALLTDGLAEGVDDGERKAERWREEGIGTRQTNSSRERIGREKAQGRTQSSTVLDDTSNAGPHL